MGLFGVNIYKHETSQTTVGGSISSTTLNVRGGLLRQVLVQAQTSLAAIFKVTIAEQGGPNILSYGYHTGELNDTGASGALPLPVLGNYTLTIQNASPNDTFLVRFLVEE